MKFPGSHILRDSSIVGWWMLIDLSEIYTAKASTLNTEHYCWLHWRDLTYPRNMSIEKLPSYEAEYLFMRRGESCSNLSIHMCVLISTTNTWTRDYQGHSSLFSLHSKLWSLTVQLQEYLKAMLHPNLSSARAWKWELSPISFSEIEFKRPQCCRKVNAPGQKPHVHAAKYEK